MEKKKYIPWVEKYRPDNFNDIVLSRDNKKILENIIKFKYFPNILFHGPPGTGKTTTIINLINLYQKTYYKENRGLRIHLNASDDRGIDIIRNQINTFVNSKGLFDNGIKFIILDEIDYMTKNAQFALKYLIQEKKPNVIYCLICNYISKVEENLQNEFLKLRFNELPQIEVLCFLKKINEAENLKFDDNKLLLIQKFYKSDLRSMINFLQNKNNSRLENLFISDKIMEKILYFILNKKYKDYLKIISQIEIEKNYGHRQLIKLFLNYYIKNYSYLLNRQLVNNMEELIHNMENDRSSYNYLFYSLFSN